MNILRFSIVFTLALILVPYATAQKGFDNLAPKQRKILAGVWAGPWIQDFRNTAVQNDIELSKEQIVALTKLCDEADYEIRLNHMRNHPGFRELDEEPPKQPVRNLRELQTETIRQRDEILTDPQRKRMQQIRWQRDWMHGIENALRRAGVKLKREQIATMQNPLAVNPPTFEFEQAIRGVDIRQQHAEGEKKGLSTFTDKQWSEVEKALGKPFDVVGTFGLSTKYRKPWTGRPKSSGKPAEESTTGSTKAESAP